MSDSPHRASERGHTDCRRCFGVVLSAAIAAFGLVAATPVVRGEPPAPSPAAQPPPAAAAKSYRIRFVAPSQPGRRWREVKQMTQLLSMSVHRGDKVLSSQQSDNVIDLAAQVTVLAVDARGYETRLRIAIERSTVTPKEKEPQEILPAGSVFFAESTEKGTQFRPEQPMPRLAALAERLLPRVFSTVNPGDTTDEEIFGRAAPVKLGDRWPADKPRLLVKLRVLDEALKPDDAEGSAELVNIARLDGRDHVDLVYKISARSEHPKNPPPDTVPLRATLKLSGAVRYPADYSTGRVAWKQEMEAEGRFQGRPGSRNDGLTFVFQSTETYQSRAEYLKPDDERNRDAADRK